MGADFRVVYGDGGFDCPAKTLHTTTKQLKSKPYASKQKQIKYKRT